MSLEYEHRPPARNQRGFCGRTPTARVDLIIGMRMNICVSCVADAVRALTAPIAVRRALHLGAGNALCRFCLRRDLSSFFRVKRGNGVICAACIASAVQILSECATDQTQRIPMGLQVELQLGAVALLQHYPELSLALHATTDDAAPAQRRR